MTMPDLDVVVDARQWPVDLAEPKRIGELWTMIEDAIRGRDLGDGPTLTLDHPDGAVRVGLVWSRLGGRPVVGPDTTFQIVNLMERPRIRYRCKECAAAGRTEYGAFTCRDCGSAERDNRLCDDHVRILDGALIATCAQHAPACAECGRAATFRCGGQRCQRRRAHCDSHRRAHPHDPDVSYCPECYDVQFPSCERPGCTNVGVARCEITDERHNACGARACGLHIRRWQVFGGERLGLGLCRRHAQALPGYPPDWLIEQIVAGACVRAATRRRDAEPLPSLRGFAHSLRRRGHEELALNFRWIHRTLGGLERAAGPYAQALQERRQGAGRYRTRKGWDAELGEIEIGEGRGRQLVERLRELVRWTLRRDGPAIAAALELADFNPAREVRGQMRPALLFVRLPEHYRGLFKAHSRQFAESLSAHEPGGVMIRIEGDMRGGRR
ncbi:hypothetical protein [Dactylosporangium sp. CA-139066]|uniref:hypothetical protein n=1 Tax=Dactylosporangium sp. CA-139066 TaxID=3239930 RepID=UPI003D8AE98D